MKKRTAMKWIAALRSGAYNQGSSQLVTVDADENEHFCCLGVLCNLATEDGYGEWDGEDFKSESGDRENKVMPWGMELYTGMESRNGTVDDDVCLTVLNDKGLSFTELADIIEKNWRKL